MLREAELVSERRDGRRRLYRARSEPLAELREYLATFWSSIGRQEARRPS